MTPTVSLVAAARRELTSGEGQRTGEALATFGLILTIIGTVRHRPTRVPASVALYIVAAYWLTSSTSSANPAITIAGSLSNSFAGIALRDVRYSSLRSWWVRVWGCACRCSVRRAADHPAHLTTRPGPLARQPRATE